MARTVTSAATFAVSPLQLYRMFMDSRLHSAAIGSPARIDPRPGGRFSVFGGSITGKTLHLIPGKLVVQTWRSDEWSRSDPDSILVVRFSGTAQRGRASLLHEGVPDDDALGIKQGWAEYYWKPWKAYLAAQRRGQWPRMR